MTGKQTNFFFFGFREMIPITTGVIPFGAVVGTLCSEVKLSFFQTVMMNLVVYAGAAQLAATELMASHTASLVVIATGLVINLRFILYSAALSPVLEKSNVAVKTACAYSLTDQSYAVMSAHQDVLKSASQTIQFYLGTAVCMSLAWHASVIAGYIFGNFAPASWALEYAVPLSFVALVIPTLKNRNYVIVAIFSALVSILLHSLPYRTGLIVTAALAVALGSFLTRKRGVR